MMATRLIGLLPDGLHIDALLVPMTSDTRKTVAFPKTLLYCA